MSERRACKATGFCRMTVRYQTMRMDDGALRERMKAMAHERRRFGYRRLHVLLRREGFVVNHKRLFRIYREELLTVRRRGGRKRAIGTRAPILIPLRPNERWSLDFVSDQFRRAALPHPHRCGRLHPRMSRSAGRHLALRLAGRARAGSPHG